MKKNYELIEHTADIGIKVKGKDLNELFKNSALAMFDIISEKKAPKSKKKIKIKIELEADDLEELIVNWLNELLYLSATKELIFSDFQIKTIDNNTLKASVTGEDIKNYRVNAEIKAATYYELKIEVLESRWQAQLIFDV
jgi:SHS2 domain-containing protein